MKKILLVSLLITIFSMSSMLFADKAKIALLQLKKVDKNSEYVVSMIKRRDFKMLLKKNEKFELLKQKTVDKVIKKSGYQDLSVAGITAITELSKQLGAKISLWGSVYSQGSDEYQVNLTVLTVNTGDMTQISFITKRDTKSRQTAIKENVIKKIEEMGSQSLDKLLQIAQQDFKQKNYEQAKESFLKILKIDPKNINSFFYLGYINALTNKLERSEEWYKKGLEIDPKNEHLMDYLSETLKREDKFDESIDVLKKLAEIKQSDKVWFRIGKLYEDQDFSDEAIEAYKQALEINPNNKEVQYRLATVLYDQELYEEAIPYLEKAAESFPDDEVIGKKLAKSYFQTGKLDAAINNYKSLISKDPKNIKAYFNLAGVYRINNQNKKSIETLLKLQKIDKDDAKVYTRLADAYVGEKNYTLAIKNAKIALKKNSELHVPYMILAQVSQVRGYKKYESYLKLDEKKNKVFGSEADKIIAQRDNDKKSAYNFFKESKSYLLKANQKTDKESVKKDIKIKLKTLNKLMKETEPSFFD